MLLSLEKAIILIYINLFFLFIVMSTCKLFHKYIICKKKKTLETVLVIFHYFWIVEVFEKAQKKPMILGVCNTATIDAFSR